MTTLACITALTLSAGLLDTIHETGVAAYGNGDYAGAISSFEQLVAEGVAEAEVFYNLGNAYYRAGRPGPAIANYERALQLNPGLTEARENLSRAVNATERRLSKPRPPAWEQALLFWDDALSPRGAYWSAAAFWLLFWSVLSIRRLKTIPFQRRIAGVLFVAALACMASYYAKTNPQRLAVASESRVPVHYGTDINETVRFELYEGDRVVVDERVGGWARVTTSDGERGWAEAQRLTFVGPPYTPASLQTPSPETLSPQTPGASTAAT